ncbi:MAG: YHS domain-containing protein [Gemmataceae bacterium]
MSRLIQCAAMVIAAFVSPCIAGEPDKSRDALQKLNEFVGEWKGVGGPDKTKVSPDDPSWKETISWAWRFKKEDRWLAFQIQNGTYLKSGEVKYLVDKARYELSVEDVRGQKATYLGQRDDKGYVTFDRTDASSGETQQFVMNMAGDGTRFVYRYAVKPKGRTVFTKVYQVAATKEGESIASKPGSTGFECIVTGGKGTIPVTYKGKTYYVCCTGCRDAFNENPEKYINEANKKK